MYPQCRYAIWIPDIVSSVVVSADTCPNCQSHARGPAKLVDVRFKPGSAPPGTACPYKACIRGCDEFINEMFDLRPPPPVNPQRPAQQQQQQPNYPPASIVVPVNSDSGSWNSRNIPDTYWDQSSSSNNRQPPQQQQQQPWPRSANNSGGGAASSVPMCSCQLPASRLVTIKEGANKGRPFFKCSKGASGGCGYFEWEDQLNTTGGSSTRQQQSYQPPASSSSLFTANGRRYEEPEVKPKCKCGLFAALRKATKSAGNEGREYYVCTRTFMACGFVCWKDDVQEYMSRPQGGQPSMPASTTSTCFKCGQSGHWARDCPNEAGASSFAHPPERHAAGGPARGARGQGKTRASRGGGGRRGRGRGGKRTSRPGNSVDEPGGEDWDSDFA
ncbi:DNA topoisomerase 3-alpha [Coemansia sp. RSA 2531]|nr:DNA topoisomerase 3-alpha [Coemansia sp. RSA 2531]